MIQILHTLCQQFAVQFFNGFHFRERDADISSNVAYEVFYQPLFVAGRGVAEYGFKSVVRRKMAVVILDRSMRAKPTLYSDTGVVEDDSLRYPTVILKSVDEGIQKLSRF